MPNLNKQGRGEGDKKHTTAGAIVVAEVESTPWLGHRSSWSTPTVLLSLPPQLLGRAMADLGAAPQGRLSGRAA